MSEKKFRELKIDEELRDLLPPQTKEEHNVLYESIKKEGCVNPIITWNDCIVDGHNRYEICKNLNFGFEEIKLTYNTKDEVKMWMLEVQLGRRNLNDVQMIMVTEIYRKELEKQAKENQLSGLKKGDRPVLSNSNKTEIINPIDTRKELAKKAGVGVEKYYRTNKILKTNNKEIKEKLIKGEISVNKAYNTLFPKKDNKQEEIDKIENLNIQQNILIDVLEVKKEPSEKTKTCLKCGQEKKINDFYICHDECKECEQNNNRSNSGNKEIFRDIEGNPIPISVDAKIDNKEFQEMLKDIKSSKSYSDVVNPKTEILILKTTCEDLIWQIDAKLFSMNKLIEKMDNEDIESTIKILDLHIQEINKLKNKLKNEKVGR